MTKKEIGFFDLSLPLMHLIILGLMAFLCWIIFTIYNPRIDLQPQIDDLNNSIPHKVCWNETIYPNNLVKSNTSWDGDIYYVSPREKGTYNVATFECKQHICYEIIQKEICEFKDNEGNIYEVKRK